MWLNDQIMESTHWTHSTVVSGVPAVASLDVVRVLAAARAGRRGGGWASSKARQMAGCLVAFLRGVASWRRRWQVRRPDAK